MFLSFAKNLRVSKDVVSVKTQLFQKKNFAFSHNGKSFSSIESKTLIQSKHLNVESGIEQKPNKIKSSVAFSSFLNSKQLKRLLTTFHSKGGKILIAKASLSFCTSHSSTQYSRTKSKESYVNSNRLGDNTVVVVSRRFYNGEQRNDLTHRFANNFEIASRLPQNPMWIMYLIIGINIRNRFGNQKKVFIRLQPIFTTTTK